MATFEFGGQAGTGLPIYGAHYTVPDAGTSVGDGYVITLSGNWDDHTSWNEVGAPYDPVAGVYAPAIPGAGDDVTIAGEPDGYLTPVQGPDMPIMDGDDVVGDVSGYYTPGPVVPDAGVGYSGSGGFNVGGAAGTVADLGVAGPGSFNAEGLTVSGTATFNAIGGLSVYQIIGTDSIQFTGYAGSAETISGGTLSAALLTLTAGTNLAEGVSGAPSATADAGSLTIMGATLSGTVLEILGSTAAAGTGAYVADPVTLTNATLDPTLELDVVGVDTTADPAATGTTTLAATGSRISAGTVIIATGTAGLGSASKTPAVVTLAGGSTLTASATTGTGTLIVGDTSTGTLVSNGSTITDQQAIITNSAAASGSATLDGGAWTNTGSITVGNSGAGTLLVENGATLSNTGTNGNGAIGGIGGSDGSTATVTGAGSNWSLDGNLIVGSGGDGTLAVKASAGVTADNVLVVGLIAGVSGTLEITGGGTVSTNAAGSPTASSTLIGDGANAIGVLTIDGAGSMLISQGAMSVGYSGDGTATVSGGATLDIASDTIRVGRNANSTGSLDIAGAGSSLIGATATLYVGFGGSGLVTVGSGGTIDMAGIDLGGEAGGVGTLEIDGGSTVANLGTAIVGDAGTGDLVLTENANVTFDDLLIGNQAGGVGVVTIDGSSSLTVTGTLDLGVVAGSSGTLTMGDGTPGFGGGADAIIGNGGTGLTRFILGDENIVKNIQAGLQSTGRGTLLIAGATTVTATGTIDLGVGNAALGIITIDGTGSILTAQSSATVGDAGAGVIQVTNGASLVVTGTLTQGVVYGTEYGGLGTISIKDPNTSASIESAWIMGLGGFAIANIDNGAAVTVAGTLSVGVNNGSYGTLDLTGQGSSLTTSGSGVTFGTDGSASVSIGPGATLDATKDNVVLATGSDSFANVTITAGQVPADTFNAVLDTKNLTVGEGGNANLHLSDYGTAIVAGNLTVGEFSSGFGVVTLDGSGSMLSIGGNLVVGADGSGFLNLSNESEPVTVAGTTTIGQAHAGELSVGDNSALQATGAMLIGNDATADVTVNGTLTANTGLIVSNADNAGSKLVVVGGTVAVSGGDFVVGLGGPGHLAIADKGILTEIGDTQVGEQSGAIGSSLMLDTGGTLITTGFLALGEVAFATGTVLAGSKLAVGGAAFIADKVGLGATLTVNGTSGGGASTFTYESLTVGNDGTGGLIVSGGAHVGGAAASVIIGAPSTGNGTILVTGIGSTLTASNIYVGSSSGGHGKLDVEAGGHVIAAAIAVSPTNGVVLNNGTIDPALTLAAGADVSGSGEIDGDIFGQGTVAIGAGGTMVLTGSIAAGIDVDFAAGGFGALSLTEPADFAAMITDFVHGDVIDFGALSGITSTFLSDQLVVKSGGVQIADLTFVGDYANGSIAVTEVDGHAEVACFVRGTRILTTAGEIAIEHLRLGMTVPTASGRMAPIVWIGERRCEPSRHPQPRAVMPVRVAAGAFGLGQPSRDLWLSPDHAVFIDGVLIPIRHLLDGAAIRQVNADSVEYFHLELDRHEVVFADGLAAESYLNTGNRGAFANGGPAVQIHPDFAWAVRDAGASAPLVVSGARLRKVRAKLHGPNGSQFVLANTLLTNIYRTTY